MSGPFSLGGTNVTRGDANEVALVTEAEAALAAANAALAAAQAAAASTAADAAATAADAIATAADAAAADADAAAAASSASQAATAYDSFDDRYLGAKSSNPTLDNDGNALAVGAIYLNTVSSEFRVYTGSGWLAVAPAAGTVIVVDTIAALKAQSVPADGTLTMTRGYSVAGKGEGVYRYVSGSSTTADDVLVIAPTAGGGRYFLEFSAMPTVQQAGAVGDGSTDDTAALQRALDTSRLIAMEPGKYRITSHLIVDPIRNRNNGFLGLTQPTIYPATSQPGGPTWTAGNRECQIVYDGPDTTALSSTSTTTMGIALVARTITVETGKSFAVGQEIVVRRTAAPNTHYMSGPITAYNSGNGSLSFTATASLGTGTYSDWTVYVPTAVMSVAGEVMTVEPSGVFENGPITFTLERVTLNGNNKALFGFYAARLQMARIHNCIARETVRDGWYINGAFSGSFTSIVARLNKGRGISLGAARLDYGWTTTALANGVTFSDLWAYANGSDKAFDETTNPTAGCGIYFAPYRGCHISRVTSELNDGAGVVFSAEGSGNKIDGLYTELSNNYSVSGGTALTELRATQPYGIIFLVPAAGGGTGNRVTDTFLAGEYLWLTGPEPSTARPENAPEFNNITGAGGIIADWATYRLVSCNEEMLAGISGSAPTSGLHLEAGVLFDRNGEALKYYDEGTFTPTIVGSTAAGTQAYTAQVGRYTRIGNRCFFNLYVYLSSTSGATGNVRVAGLPFVSKTVTNYFSAVTIAYWNGITSAIAGGTVFSNTSYIDIYVHAAGAVTSLAASELTNTSRFMISGSYEVA